MENRAYFITRSKLGKTVPQIKSELTNAFPDSSPGLSTLHTWSKEIKDGTFTSQKRTSSGRPRETRTPENFDTVKLLVDNNPRITTLQVSAEVSLPPTTVFRILTEDLGLKNVLSVLVPHQLSEKPARAVL